MPRHEGFKDIELTMKKAAQALREADVPFLLAGSLATWARGGPETTHDLDFVVKPDDAERALQALVDAGMRAEKPPEEWLFKAWDGDVLVDLIFGPMGLEITDELIARGDEIHVMAITLRVMALEDVLTSKLLAMNEHDCDYHGVLEMARSLREQVDWDEVRGRTKEWPFGRGFFAIAEGLGLVPSGDGVERAAPSTPRVRVV
jgi:hypothetical protein